ncbi:MAG: hypothetical protein K2X55_26865 [Burkholderiaceae bacterium]|nr:hypothetical protein [Burkholderiaceae bacterium]
MNSPITDMEAKVLLDNVARKSKARAVLASRPSYAMRSLVSSIAIGVGVYAMADFVAPMAVKILIIIGFFGGIFGQIEALMLQRRLEAAIELLRQSDTERA